MRRAVMPDASDKMNRVRGILLGQPIGVLLRYYIVAQNNAGESQPSNTIEVKL